MVVGEPFDSTFGSQLRKVIILFRLHAHKRHSIPLPPLSKIYLNILFVTGTLLLPVLMRSTSSLYRRYMTLQPKRLQPDLELERTTLKRNLKHEFYDQLNFGKLDSFY